MTKPKPTDKTYTVHVTYTMIHEVKVKAKDTVEAIKKARDEFSNAGDYSADDFDDIQDVCITDIH